MIVLSLIILSEDGHLMTVDCTLDLFLGDNVYANASAFNYSLHFGGAAVLASSIKKLGELGLAKARPRMGRGAIHGIQTPLSIFGETLKH